MAKYDILVAGELNPDLILSDPELQPEFGQIEVLVESAELTIGASSAIFACGAVKLGLSVAFIGVVGDDMFGRFMVNALKDKGVDVSPVIVNPNLKTGLSVILNRDTDRAILTHLGAINALKAEQVTNELISQANHLHVADYFLQTNMHPGILDLFNRARRLGVSTSLDTNWDPARDWSGVVKLLGSTNVFSPNEAEAEALTGTSNLHKAADILTEKVEVVTIKQGAAGAMAKHGDEVVQVSALPVEVVDTVGAGDSFDAGFVYGYLQGWSLKDSLQLGTACGSLSTCAHGGVTAQPTLEEALAAVRHNK